VNLETAFWLESDRMLGLSFDPEVLEVQRKVVIEEFKQRYLNQPYGDAWLKLRPLAYKVHPYRWATIGKDISHIEQATLQDVKDFFYTYYLPNNAIMVVAGPVKVDEIKELAQKWFGSIPAGKPYVRKLQAEPPQQEARYLEVEANVPLDAIYKVFHTPGKSSTEYYTADLLSDILGRSKSSRLYDKLVKEAKLFNSINAYVSGSADPGLLVIQGHLNQGVSIERGEAEISAILDEMIEQQVAEPELNKVKNQAEATLVFSEVELLNRAMNLAFNASLGNPELINQESAYIQAVTPESLQAMAKRVLRKENSSTLYYRAKNGQ
jgi:predicted Zn-dependent peptidase